MFKGLALFLTLALAAPALSADGTPLKGVVELFTSQGCGSCPPADRAFEALVRQGDVVALAYHVDYWNYMGWADTLASKENTTRQYGYARSLGRSGVYTPQAILNGRDHMKGTDVGAINQKLDALEKTGDGLSIPVEAEKKGDELVVKVGAGVGKADVVVVYFRRKETVELLKGENVGKKMVYWNSVTDVQTVGMWDGKPLDLVLPAKLIGADGNSGCAILLQSTGPQGEPAGILGATMMIDPAKI